MPSRRNRGRPRRIPKIPRDDFEEAMQRKSAFAAISALYCESLPLWRVCKRGVCRRNKCCRGTPKSCLIRGWDLFGAAEQNRAWRLVQDGGPRRLPPATALERGLRHYPPSNFTHA